MLPSRYYVINERSPNLVKRRATGRREKLMDEPAITLLPPDPYMIGKRPEYVRSPSPTVYRTVPPKSAKNKEASSFVILGDTIRTPVQSRPGSPSGRVSPFRGHGFKSPTTTRPNSRVASPVSTPKRTVTSVRSNKSEKNSYGDRPRFGRDIGLPPKSPMKSNKPQKTEEKSSDVDSKDKLDKKVQSSEEKLTEETEKTESIVESKEKSEPTDENQKEEESEAIEENDVTKRSKTISNVTTDKTPDSVAEFSEQDTEKSTSIVSIKPEMKSNEKGNIEKLKPIIKSKLTPTLPKEKEDVRKSKKPPVSPIPRNKVKTEASETNTQNTQSVIKKSTKPPIPPKKVGLKSTLKAEDPINEVKKSPKLKQKELTKMVEKKQNESDESKVSKSEKIVKNDTKKDEEKKNTSVPPEKISLGDTVLVDTKKVTEKNKKPDESASKISVGGVVEEKKPEEKPKEKVIPCFQPDKCQIAPPTMASPSPIITPTISTPSTSADLSSSSMKNSQSIAAAPTTVTSSSLSSVSSTVVLSGNLARKEIAIRSGAKKTVEGSVSEGSEEGGAKEVNGSAVNNNRLTSDVKVSTQMVKAVSRDSIKWSNKENLSGEITSATKVIKAEPDMEVLSPNNLRNSPPRMPPPNMAWDEERLPNGDVPNRAVNEGKFRRFFSAFWRLLIYLFCCRCVKSSQCCRKSNEIPKPSIFSKLNCCKNSNCCGNPFQCCSGCCSKCSKAKCCEGKKCCGKKSNPNPKPKPKSKSRKCCAKPSFNCKGCCDEIKNRCLNSRVKLNNACRSLFCLNTMCCQKLLKKCKCCHKLKCCQKNGFCSCCNPYVKKENRMLHKKGSHASNHSRDKDQLDLVLVEHTSLMKAAIPVLPTCLAVFCLICNLLIPGIGTFISGMLCLCFGKPRFSTKDSPKNRMGSFVVNTIIGVAQLFTVVFCLVGWGWSIWWGVIMYKLARRQKRIKLAEKSQKEAEASNVNHNHVDVEQG